jgi:urease accessory protein
VPGRGRIRVERSGARSVVTRAYATSPLRLLTPANHGRAAWIYTSSYGGGLVDGDAIELEVTVGPGAAAFVSTQASTKVYRSPRGTTTEVRGHVDAGALLVMAPDPVVPFSGARYRQVQRYTVTGDGALVVVDAMSSGRRAAGERWAFAEYFGLIDVSVDGRRFVYDAMALRAADGDLATRLGRFDALAVAVVAGAPFGADAARLVSDAAALSAASGADPFVTVAPLRDAGCVVRMAASGMERVTCALRSLLAFVPQRLGEDPWTRKW